MYKSQIRKMVGDMTEQQLILLWNMFLEDTKYNTVHIHRLSNSIVSQVYRLPVVRRIRLQRFHLDNLIFRIITDIGLQLLVLRIRHIHRFLVHRMRVQRNIEPHAPHKIPRLKTQILLDLVRKLWWNIFRTAF